MHRRTLLTAALMFPAALAAGPALAKKRFRVFAPAGIALGGADPVAYFTAGRAMAGRSDIALKWGGAIWCFASEEHRSAFEMNPVAYLPRYGGHCAWAMSQGERRGAVPEVWALRDGRLYLGASEDNLGRFLSGAPATIEAADSVWTSSNG